MSERNTAMKNLDLANCSDTPIAEIVKIGSTDRKKEIEDSLPIEIRSAFQKRTYWIHDMEYYYSAYNCIGINPSDLIGTSTDITFSHACRELVRGIIELTNSQSGGIGIIDFDSDLGKYVHNESDETLTSILYELILDMNMFVRKGCEMPYVTFNFGLCINQNGRRVAKALLHAYSMKQFVFPNLVFKLRKGINTMPCDVNYDIYCLASEVTSTCMNPTYLNTDASYNRDIPFNEFGIMGCRTRIASNRFHSPSSIKRGNIAAVTINLVQLAIESNKSDLQFMELINETMQKAKAQLLHRYKNLIKQGYFQLLKNKSLYVDCNKNVQSMMRNGTLSIGFIGLWDALSVLHVVDFDTAKKIKENYEYAYNIIKIMRNNVDEYSNEENLNFSLLASSAEGVSGFLLQYDSKYYPHNRVFDRGFYGNSFHIPVDCKVDCFEKIDFEAPFHQLCNGGHITYVELQEVPFGNSEAIRELVDYACNKDIGYFGINFPLDICRACGAKGMFSENCIQCGSSDIQKLRRVSGYLSEINNFTIGKTNELFHRIAHIGNTSLFDM